MRNALAPTRIRMAASATALALITAACTSPADDPVEQYTSWDSVTADAEGQEVSLWMWGGDDLGNSYVDDVLVPAVAEHGVTLTRIPIPDTAEAINRVLAEQQAGVADGAVDVVWINGENFRTGVQADAWACDWPSLLPHMQYVNGEDPLMTSDFGTPVNGCEVPWHQAQFVIAYDAADVDSPPASVTELYDWVQDNPGRFTYPAPPDFTGSTFLRLAYYEAARAAGEETDMDAPSPPPEATEALWEQLSAIDQHLWRGGDTYPQDVSALNELFANDQVSFTLTYGPATLEALVSNGTFPDTTRVLEMEDGTLGNASFLAIPRNASNFAGAMVVVNEALSPEQQLAKARTDVWGQYSVLDTDLLPDDIAAEFAAITSGEVVPPFSVLSRNASPELPASWVAEFEQGWRDNVLNHSGD